MCIKRELVVVTNMLKVCPHLLPWQPMMHADDLTPIREAIKENFGKRGRSRQAKYISHHPAKAVIRRVVNWTKAKVG